MLLDHRRKGVLGAPWGLQLRRHLPRPLRRHRPYYEQVAADLVEKIANHPAEACLDQDAPTPTSRMPIKLLNYKILSQNSRLLTDLTQIHITR